ncbi:MAG: exodeoxyribonuclease VII small subunit [Deltaproteobacteria bacterium]|jgi:exodeoxyribonuclease VII small subunit|nr:exodeoxyribonuclease VII small subunit [Deltaproteobacteria bacterium]
MKKENIEKSFEANFKKLEQLSKELQEDNISIDELVPRMKEALTSIKICKEVLQETKVKLTEVSNEFKELNTSND